MNSIHQWQVLSRAECSLCETMLIELANLLGDQISQVQVCDIEGNAELEHKYGQRIPVLLIDGEFVCAYKLDQHRAKMYLSQSR